ncbi:MAG: DUF2283 domain-containing protein [Candidatus Bathyarchaeia archaeon]
MTKAQVKMAVDLFRVIGTALKKSQNRLPRLISVDYDEDGDVLYARFSHAKIVDSKALDEDGMVMASLGSNGRTVGLVVMHASTLM